MTHETADLRDVGIAGGLFTATMVLYAATAARHLQGGDAGEFALIAQTGGYAHPPGYPLFSLLVRSGSWLPLPAEPATTASLVTAAIGACAVAVTYLAARCWRRTVTSSLLAAGGFALAADVWLFQTLPEVFAFNHLVVAGIAALSSPFLRIPTKRRVVGIGLLFGLGLANHLSVIFITPVTAYGLWQSILNKKLAYFECLQLLVISVGLGLLPYLYILVGNHSGAWHWGDVASLQALLDLFLRADYGVTSMTAGESAGPTGTLVWFWAKSVTVDLAGILPLAALGAFVVAGRNLWSKREPQQASLGLIWFGVAILLAGPVFGAMLSRQPDGLSIRIMRRMHLLSEWLIAFTAAFGVDAVRNHLSNWLVYTLVSFVVAAMATIGLLHVRSHHTDTVQNYILDTRDALPNNAILLGTGDHRFFGNLYADRVLEHRTDITYVDAYLTAYPWYRQRLAGRERLDVPGPAAADQDIELPELVSALADSERPICITHPFHPTLTDEFRWIPTGTAMCRTNSVTPLGPIELNRYQRDWLENARNFPPPSAPEPSWAAHALSTYARNWSTLADALQRTGHTDAAEQARKLGETFE